MEIGRSKLLTIRKTIYDYNFHYNEAIDTSDTLVVLRYDQMTSDRYFAYCWTRQKMNDDE